MNKSTRILCPNCELMGLKQTIGVILDSGDISIQRSYYKPGYREFTIIRGNDFELICGKCSGMVYFRKGGQDENSFERGTRIFRIALTHTTYKLGTQSNYGTS